MAGRKRKRSDPSPAPFFTARARLSRSYQSRPDVSIERAMLSVVTIAGERLLARDYPGAASVLPVLFRRYRRSGSCIWYYPREVAVSGAELLRRAHPQLLDRFLTALSRDGRTSVAVSSVSAAHATRDIALLERALELVCAQEPRAALEALMEEAVLPHFEKSVLVQAYLGMLALALSNTYDDPAHMLAVASNALNKASSLDPSAYCFVHYAAAAAVAAGDVPKALQMQRDFVSAHPADAFALHALLLSLTYLEKNSMSVQNEKVQVARKLLVADPIAGLPVQVLREASAWKWSVLPEVSTAEIADAVAVRIEHGAADESTWTELVALLEECAPNERLLFWQVSGRATWWPTHFFKYTRVNGDVAKSPQLATAKARAASILLPGCPYSRLVRSGQTADC